MQYTRLGKSDLLVSRICMGCMGFGDPLTGQHRWTLDETASRDIIRYGLEKGINYHRADKAAEVTDGVNRGNARCRCRAAKKHRWHTPEWRFGCADAHGDQR